MLFVQEAAGFTKGESDRLRKALGKHLDQTIDMFEEKFYKGCKANAEFVNDCGDKEKVDEIIAEIWRIL